MFNFVDFFIIHDIFYFGIIDAFVAMIYWGVIIYCAIVPYEKNALKITLNRLFPVFVAGFFAAFIGLTSIMAGILIIMVFILSLHYFSHLPWKKIISISIPLFFYLFVLFYIVSWLRIPVLLIYSTLLFIQGKIEMRGKKKFES